MVTFNANDYVITAPITPEALTAGTTVVVSPLTTLVQNKIEVDGKTLAEAQSDIQTAIGFDPLEAYDPTDATANQTKVAEAVAAVIKVVETALTATLSDPDPDAVSAYAINLILEKLGDIVSAADTDNPNYEQIASDVESAVSGGYSDFGDFADSYIPETPTISVPPADATYEKGDTAAALSVTVNPLSDGGTLSYQWYKNATDSNENGTALAITPTYVPWTSDVGTIYYYVVVTNTRNGKSVSIASATAKITVTAPGLPTTIDQLKAKFPQFDSTGLTLTKAGASIRYMNVDYGTMNNFITWMNYNSGFTQGNGTGCVTQSDGYVWYKIIDASGFIACADYYGSKIDIGITDVSAPITDVTNAHITNVFGNTNGWTVDEMVYERTFTGSDVTAKLNAYTPLLLSAGFTFGGTMNGNSGYKKPIDANLVYIAEFRVSGNTLIAAQWLEHDD